MLKKKNINQTLYVFNKKKNNTNFYNKGVNYYINKINPIYYNPPYSKEWKDSVYLFNRQIRSNITINIKIINEIIKEYFNIFFNKKLVQNKKNIRSIKKFKVESFYRLYVSKVEIKHTNFKSIITIYVFNKDKQLLFSYLKKKLYILSIFLRKIFKVYLLFKIKGNNVNMVNLLKRKIIIFIYNTLKKGIKKIWRYKLLNNLNKYKFEENFLSKLALLLSEFLNKKIEFSVVKISNIIYSTDMFTQNIGMRYKRKIRFNVVSILARAFRGMHFPIEDIDRNPKKKMKQFVDLNLLKNKYKNLYLIDMLKVKELFDLKLYEIYGFLNLNVKDKFTQTLNYIQYKKIRGLKIMANGRLTMRYRADRALHKFLIEGGLRNIDSSFKGLKTGIYRGNVKINTEYSLYESKRRIGTYAVKGWLSFL